LKNNQVSAQVIQDKFQTIYNDAGITVSASLKEQINNATNEEERLGLKLGVMKDEIQKANQQRDIAKRMNIIFGILSVFSLLTMALLLVKKVVLPGTELGSKKKDK